MNACDFYGMKFVDLLLTVVRKVAEKCFQELQNISENKRQQQTFDDMDLICVMRCLIGLLENNQGKLGEYFQVILNLTVDLFNMNTRTTYFKKFLAQVFAILIWYDPKLTVQTLQSTGQLDNILRPWLMSVTEFTNDYEKERCLYGLCSIISMNKCDIPDFCDSKAMMSTIAKISNELVSIRAQDGNSTKDDEAEEATMQSGYLGLDGGIQEWYQMEQNKDIKLNPNQGPNDVDLGLGDDECDSDWDGDEAFLENESFEYDSPMEKFCPLIFLKNILASKEVNDPEFCQELANSLNDQDRKELMDNINIAEKQLADSKSFFVDKNLE